jgi:hypothetical protein
MHIDRALLHVFIAIAKCHGCRVKPLDIASWMQLKAASARPLHAAVGARERIEGKKPRTFEKEIEEAV